MYTDTYNKRIHDITLIYVTTYTYTYTEPRSMCDIYVTWHKVYFMPRTLYDEHILRDIYFSKHSTTVNYVEYNVFYSIYVILYITYIVCDI